MVHKEHSRPIHLWRDFKSALDSMSFDVALQIAIQAATYHVERSNMKLAGMWQRATADVLYRMGRYSEAAGQARLSATVQPDPYEKALSFVAEGQMHTYAGRYKTAMTAFGKAEDLARQFAGDVYLFSHLYGNRAIAYKKIGEFDRAIIEWEGAASLMIEAGHIWRASLSISTPSATFWLSAANSKRQRLACCRQWR